MTIHRLQLNGMTEQQWNDLAALAQSSGITRTEYVRRCLTSVVDDGYVPPFTYTKQQIYLGNRKGRRFYPGHWTWIKGITTYNLVIATSKPFLEAIDEERNRYGIGSRHMFVYQCVAWYLDMQYVWEDTDVMVSIRQ